MTVAAVDASASVPDPDSGCDFELSPLGSQRLLLRFDEPEMTSDAGIVLLREVEKQTGMIAKVAGAIEDRRDANCLKHSVEHLVKQRVMQIISGYEDAVDCNDLRHDAAMKISCERGTDEQLASQPTMSRLENSVRARDLLKMGYAIAENFVDSFATPPPAVVIDMDPSAHEVYGQQQLELFSTHVGGHCLMPFYVYDGLTGKVITATIRPGKTPVAREILALLKRIVSFLRSRWPRTLLIFRADSHHCKPEVLWYLDDMDIDFVIGLSPNSALHWLNAQILHETEQARLRTMLDQRRYHSFTYAAGSWRREFRVISRSIATDRGTDQRYIVTSFQSAKAAYVYDEIYAPRGNAELHIKEQKLDLSSDRSSCTKATANQFRLLIHTLAYQVLFSLRENVLRGTKYAKATMGTIRLKLLKVAARVECRKRHIRFHLPESFPARTLLARLAVCFQSLPSP